VDATPLALLREDLAGKALIYSTTNGTVALSKVKDVACRPFARSPPVAAPRAGPHRLGPKQFETPPGPWRRVMRRPVLIGEIASAVEELSRT